MMDTTFAKKHLQMMVMGHNTERGVFIAHMCRYVCFFFIASNDDWLGCTATVVVDGSNEFLATNWNTKSSLDLSWPLLKEQSNIF